jgi:hypothetical protein
MDKVQKHNSFNTNAPSSESYKSDKKGSCTGSVRVPYVGLRSWWPIPSQLSVRWVKFKEPPSINHIACRKMRPES